MWEGTFGTPQGRNFRENEGNADRGAIFSEKSWGAQIGGAIFLEKNWGTQIGGAICLEKNRSFNGDVGDKPYFSRVKTWGFIGDLGGLPSIGPKETARTPTAKLFGEEYSQVFFQSFQSFRWLSQFP